RPSNWVGCCGITPPRFSSGPASRRARGTPRTPGRGFAASRPSPVRDSSREVDMVSNEHPDPRSGGAGLRVLVVEDDPDLAAGLAGWLGRCGHEARVAPD